jgi:hypothetical protein
MRRRLLTLTLLGLAAVGFVASAGAVIIQKGNVRVALDGGFTPHSLPRDRLAPVKVEIQSRIFTVDGSQPPPLRELEIGLNRHGRLSALGLPTCRPGFVQSRSTSAALARCRGALVGHGSFQASISFGSGEAIPAKGSVLVFNSRKHGHPGLLLHFFVRSPVESTLVLPLRIEHTSEGEFGIALRTKVPKLGGDVGSITGIKLTVGRSYEFRGERHSYLSASCTAPAGFSGVPFPFMRGTFTFAGEDRITTTIVRSCHVRR